MDYTKTLFIHNNTPICLKNIKSLCYIGVNKKDFSFALDSTHPYLYNSSFESNISHSISLVNVSKTNEPLNYLDQVVLLTK